MGWAPVVEVAEAVADAKDVEPEELSYSLEEHVDTEALQLLAEHSSSTWTLSFTLPEYEVTVTGKQIVRVDERQKVNT